MQESHFLHTYKLESDGNAESLNPDEDIDFSSRDDSYNWIHMCALHPETRRFLENDADLDPIIIDALLAEETRPRSLIKEDGMLVILRAMNLYEGRDPEDMISIRIWIDDKKVITTRVRNIPLKAMIAGILDTGPAINKV